MSYMIVYSRNFIKLGEDKYIPLVLTGANNSRERYWSSLYKFSKLVLSASEILDRVKDVDGYFTYNNKWMMGNVVKFYADGIKKARYIEEYSAGVIVRVSNNYVDRFRVSNIRTTQDLLSAIETANDFIGDEGIISIEFMKREKIK